MATPDEQGQAIFRDVYQRLFGRDPRYRYWRTADGWIIGWTTERMGDGKFAAFEYKPIGKGSRSGKPQQWKLSRERHFTKRKTAKAHAQDWMRRRARI